MMKKLLLSLLFPIVALAQPAPGTKVTVCQGNNCATVSAANALKVDGSAVTQPVSGTVTANQGGAWDINNISGTVSLPTGAATSALQSTLNTILSSVIKQDNYYTGANGVFALGWDDNNTQWSAIPLSSGTVPISGSVSTFPQTGRAVLANVSAIGTTSPVSIGATGAVYIGVRGTYSNLAFSVEGEIDSATGAFATVPITRIANPVVTESAPSGLSNLTQFWLVPGAEAYSRIRLNVSAISSGTANFVYIQPPNASIISGAVTANPPASTTTTGNITANGQSIPVTLQENKFVNVKISGTYTSVAIIFEVSFDGGATYDAALMSRIDSNTVESASGTISNTTRTWRTNTGAATHFRVRSTAYASGTMAVRINTSNIGAEPVPAIGTHAVTQSGTWSVRAQDGSGNLLTSQITTPGKSDRGLTVRNIDATSTGIKTNTLTANLAEARTRAYYTTRTTTTGSTTTVINVTVDPSTQVQPGDWIYISSGTLAQGKRQEGEVLSVNTTSITLVKALAVAPASGLTVEIYESRWLRTDTGGRLETSIYSANPIPTYPQATQKTHFESGEMDDATIAATLGTPAIVGTLGNNGVSIHVSNTTDVPLKYSIDDGATYHHIAAGDNHTFIFTDWGGFLSAGDKVYVTYTNGPPTTGYFSYLMTYV